jgi:lysophospholipase L1-like esterase
VPTFDLFQGRADRLSADRYHPNAEAYGEIAERMLQVVK